MMSSGMVRIAVPPFSPDDVARAPAVGLRRTRRDASRVVQIAEVEEAARLGADAVVLFTALGGDTEPA